MIYTDLLTKIRNAQAVKKESVKTPYSKMAEAIVNILSKNNYLESCEKKGRGHKKVLDIRLKYNEGRGVINGVKFVSKPSRRIYIGYEDLRPVRHGYGLAILSTPRGVISSKEAKKSKIGGELLFEIW